MFGAFRHTGHELDRRFVASRQPPLSRRAEKNMSKHSASESGGGRDCGEAVPAALIRSGPPGLLSVRPTLETGSALFQKSCWKQCHLLKRQSVRVRPSSSSSHTGGDPQPEFTACFAQTFQRLNTHDIIQLPQMSPLPRKCARKPANKHHYALEFLRPRHRHVGVGRWGGIPLNGCCLQFLLLKC